MNMTNSTDPQSPQAVSGEPQGEPIVASGNLPSAASTPITTPIRLAPSFTIPIVLVLGAIPLIGLSIWGAAIISIFGLFLMYQTTSIRLEFTATALDVYRGNSRFRQFPYAEWLNWEVFWSPVPILFYFREVNSIHFVPMLFNVEQLRQCLDRAVPREQLLNATPRS